MIIWQGGIYLAVPDMKIKKRARTMLFVFALLFLVMIARIFYWQFIADDRLRKEAFVLQNSSRVISPRRGTIRDRNGKEIAISASVETVGINPKEIRNADRPLAEIAAGLADILDMQKEDILAKMNKNSSYELIKRKIERNTGNLIRKFARQEKIPGIDIYEDTKRFYPYGNLAAHIIGYTGTDNQGLDGIELMMEKYLRGLPGRIMSEVDARGNEIAFGDENRIAPQDGYDVILTIDETIQHFVNKELDRAIADNKVENGATAIVMDPSTGDLLAICSKPDYDLNKPFGPLSGYTEEEWKGLTLDEKKQKLNIVWRDKAISDAYEPGSTFKAITSVAGLEEGIVNPDTVVNDYPVKIGKWTFNCWRRGNLHGNETFTEGVYNSCNPVFVRIAQSIGIPKFYDYVRSFGFYEKTGIILPGESTGLQHVKPSEVDMAAGSFGQRFTITPIQLITAYCAIANGGKLLKPRLVKELSDVSGNIVKTFPVITVRNVISKQTATTMKSILQGVVSEGTGKNAYVPGYRVAGKTGTSQTTDRTRYIASFSSIAPADNPSICVLVVLDNPKGDSHMGGAIAAPVAGRIIEQVLSYLQVEKIYNDKDRKLIQKEVIVPDVTGMSIAEAQKLLKSKNLSGKSGENNEDGQVVSQMPLHGTLVNEGSVIYLYTGGNNSKKLGRVPDLLGENQESALSLAAASGFNLKRTGTGSVVSWQSPEPGTSMPSGTIITVEMKNLDNIE